MVSRSQTLSTLSYLVKTLGFKSNGIGFLECFENVDTTVSGILLGTSRSLPESVVDSENPAKIVHFSITPLAVPFFAQKLPETALQKSEESRQGWEVPSNMPETVD